MRAVGITRPGGPEVLEVVDRPVREPGAGEVRITVRAAAVNPTDIGVRDAGIDDLPAPWTPGMDAAGTIESVGDGVDRLTVGDEVMAVVSPRRPDGGAQAAQIVVPAASAGRLGLRVAREFSPEQAGEAQSLMDAGGLRGRAVIVFED